MGETISPVPTPRPLEGDEHCWVVAYGREKESRTDPQKDCGGAAGEDLPQDSDEGGQNRATKRSADAVCTATNDDSACVIGAGAHADGVGDGGLPSQCEASEDVLEKRRRVAAAVVPDAVVWRGRRERLDLLTESAAAEEAARRMVAELDGEALGLDTEWSATRDAAVLQLSGPGRTLVCLLPEVDLRACPSLRRLLADRDVAKAGVGVGRDAELLRERGAEVRGCVDLFLLAVREEFVDSAQPCGLAFLSRTLVGEELTKDVRLRKDDWSRRPLSAERLVYAAKDALAGRDAARELRRRSEAGRRSPSMAAWCSDLLDRAPKFRSVSGKAPLTPGDHILSCPSYKNFKKFGQRQIVDSDGRPMLHMRDRTCDALLRRGLASVDAGDAGGTIRLHFRPGDNYDYAGLDAAERNACVGCGADGVARFFVIPNLFWEHLPAACKTYNCHDILLLCPRCRVRAALPVEAKVQELLAGHGARRAGRAYANENARSAGQGQVKKAAGLLLSPPTGRRGSLPAEKLLALRRTVAAELGIEVELITREHLQALFRRGEGPSPSERICEAASADADSLRKFLKMWRDLFVLSLQPKFLPEGWGVETGLNDGRFVPSVANTVRWPGDWFCSACGVHCFGSLVKCKNCGRDRGSEDPSTATKLIEGPIDKDV